MGKNAEIMQQLNQYSMIKHVVSLQWYYNVENNMMHAWFIVPLFLIKHLRMA